MHEIIRALGIELPSFNFGIDLLGNSNLTTWVLQSMEAKKASNQSIPKMTSKSNISSFTNSTNVTLEI